MHKLPSVKMESQTSTPVAPAAATVPAAATDTVPPVDVPKQAASKESKLKKEGKAKRGKKAVEERDATAVLGDALIDKCGSVKVHLEPDKVYWYCMCGRSRTQPFCDGSHQGTSIQPLPLQVEESKVYGLCGCRCSDTMPFCDGSHKRPEVVKEHNTQLQLQREGLHCEVRRWRALAIASAAVAMLAVGVASSRRA